MMPVTGGARNAVPTQAGSLWQFLRAGVVTALVIGIAAAAHTGAGGHLPAVPLMALLTALIMAPVTALSRRRISLPVLAAILATGQGFLHSAFSALSGQGQGCGPAGIAAHSHHQEMVVPECATAAPADLAEAAFATGSGPTAMTAAHVLATALTVLALGRAEAALWQLRAWLRPLTHAPRPAVLPPVVAVPIPRTASQPRKSPGTRIAAPRGPPGSRTLLPVL